MVASGSGVAFIAQGSPIPIKQFSTSGVTLTPQKIAMGVAFSRELIEHTNAETMVRALLAENLSLGLDNILFDANPADGTRPQGLRNGVAATHRGGRRRLIRW